MRASKGIFLFVLILFINLNCVLTGNFGVIGSVQSIKADTHTIVAQRIFNSGNTYKVGQSCSYNFLALIAAGDSSIISAIRKGNIAKPITVDQVVINYLGLFGMVCTNVSGE